MFVLSLNVHVVALLHRLHNIFSYYISLYKSSKKSSHTRVFHSFHTSWMSTFHAFYSTKSTHACLSIVTRVCMSVWHCHSVLSMHEAVYMNACVWIGWTCAWPAWIVWRNCMTCMSFIISLHSIKPRLINEHRLPLHTRFLLLNRVDTLISIAYDCTVHTHHVCTKSIDFGE